MTRRYTAVVPTNRPRYQVTETEALARALELAEQQWPGEPRSRLIERLATAGAAQLGAQHAERRAQRMAALDAMRDMFTGAFPPDYLEQLRKDWPE